MTDNSPGLWICIDGPDFTGKGTQTVELIRRLIVSNEDNVVAYTHEPTRNARALKDKLKREKGDAYKDPQVTTHLYVDDRVENENAVIRPTLANGGIAVSNRFKYSTLAYQAAQGMNMDELIRMHKERGIGTPDITLILFMDDEDELRSRMARTGKTGDKFESDFDFQRKVAFNYRTLIDLAPSDPEFFGPIYAANKHPTASIWDVSDSIWEKIQPVYNAWSLKRDAPK